MDDQQLSKAFAATVQASLHGLQSLHALLQREQQALTGRDPALLEQLVRDKLTLLKELEYSVQARDRLQVAAGLETGIDGGRQIAERCCSLLPALTADWEKLNTLARTVAELNDHNGQLVIQRQRTTRSALEVLTGRPRREDTYSTLRRRTPAAASCSLGRV